MRLGITFAIPNCFAALVKGLRRIPFTDESRVRFPYAVQIGIFPEKAEGSSIPRSPFSFAVAAFSRSNDSRQGVLKVLPAYVKGCLNTARINKCLFWRVYGALYFLIKKSTLQFVNLFFNLINCFFQDEITASAPGLSTARQKVSNVTNSRGFIHHFKDDR